MSVLWGNGRLGVREEEKLTRQGQSKWGTWKRQGEPRRAEESQKALGAEREDLGEK